MACGDFIEYGRQRRLFPVKGRRLFYFYNETFEKCSILVKVKKGDNFNHRNILNISRIKI